MAQIHALTLPFEGEPLTTLTWDGKPAWVAREMGRRLGYAGNGKRLVTRITREWGAEFIEGKDYVLLAGEELAAFKAAVGLGTPEVPSRAGGLMLLLEPGLHLVLTKTNKPILARSSSGRDRQDAEAPEEAQASVAVASCHLRWRASPLRAMGGARGEHTAMNRKLVLASQDGVSQVWETQARMRDYALVGIRSPGEPDLDERLTGPKLQLRFDDASWPDGQSWTYPSRADAEKIVTFARGLSPDEGGLIVHCAYGISRSSAAMVGVLATWGLDGRELCELVQDAAHRGRAKKLRGPAAVFPNARLIAHLDRVLGLDGELGMTLTEHLPGWITPYSMREQFTFITEDSE